MTGSALLFLPILVGLWGREPTDLHLQQESTYHHSLGSETFLGFALFPRQSQDELAFPRDDGPHPETAVEWWYWYGTLQTGNGEFISFHSALFHLRLPSEKPRAVLHASFLRSGMPRADFMQLTADNPRWDQQDGCEYRIGEWQFSFEKNHQHLRMIWRNRPLLLELRPARAPVLHNRDGLIQGEDFGSFHYYSRSRLRATLSYDGGDDRKAWTGLAWQDHQWGSPGVLAMPWDWIGLQLDDGSELMLYQLRSPNGSTALGTLVDRHGAVRVLETDQYQLESTGKWVSLRSGIAYPQGWHIRIPASRMDLRVVPRIADCEFDARQTTMRFYWEGSVLVSGTHQGSGFVELTGYGIP